MRSFEAEGTFWFPDNPGRRISGKLTFDGDAIELTLRGSLHEFTMPAEAVASSPLMRVDEEVLFGRLHSSEDSPADVDRVTLQNISGVIIPGPFEVVSESYSVGAVLRGVHTRVARVSKARVTFDALEAWTDPPMLVRAFSTEGNFEASVAVDVLAEATYRELTFRLMTVGEGKWGDHIHVDRHTFIEIDDSGEGATFQDLLNAWVRPITDLLALSLGQSVAVTDLRVEAVDEDAQARFAVLTVPATQAPARRNHTPSDFRIPGTSALLLPGDLYAPFPVALPEWFDMRSEVHAATILITAPYYASFMYSENRYANVFQAAEALAKRCFDTTELPKDSHRSRVSSVVGAARTAGVSNEVVEWAARVLGSRNDRPLHALIDELLMDSGAVGAAICSAVPDAAKRMARARTGVAHGGANDSTTLMRYWLGELITWVVRMHLIREIGVPPQVLEKRVLQATSFRRALREAGALG